MTFATLHIRTMGWNLGGALTFAALAFSGPAHAQSVQNTATVSPPSGAFETNTANNSATDSDTLLATLVATDDNASGAFGFAGATDVVSVLANDTVNGVAATTSSVTISLASGASVPAGFTFDTADGTVDVAAGTAAGTYNFDYQICETANPSNCDTATVSITITPPVIIADPDSAGGVNGAVGASDVLNVLDGDTIGGVAATTGNVTITVASGSSVPSGLSFDVATGSVSVDPATPGGTYTFDYTICDAVNPANCSSNTVSITVDVPAITADDDSVSGLNGVAGGTNVLDVIDGDTLNGAQTSVAAVSVSVITPATPIGGGNVPTLDTSTGLIQLPASTPAGTYSIVYQIEDRNNPGNVASATATIVVSPSVDLSLTKTNNVTEVRPGDTVTYVLTIGNAGPDAATGAVVTDTPGSGLTCPSSGPLAFGGSATGGAPAGSPTVGDLTGAGVTLGTIGASETVTITYDCTVD